ncbi:hypothetical protein [Glutamicibacter ardleyensis]|uniref:Uncharacterized protein n=1 Tax=Glutamicibacter ardleyensis TaxID=225894 RepID=A0ABQ2DF63_9MICC|nr:hypothetical protein [Glutamicibacter ardleyensis]GGJ55871.1 hypothetical protein GCM10007173_13400 [Glutamicibacter ardleyensis]
MSEKIEAVRQALQDLMNEGAKGPLLLTGWVACVNVVMENGATIVLKASPSEQPRALDYGLLALVHESETSQIRGQSSIRDLYPEED